MDTAAGNRHIPMDIIEKILLYLPVKSLVRFRCVSRRWNSKISEPSFIRKHLSITQKTRPQLVINHNSYIHLEQSSICSIPDLQRHSIEDAARVIYPFDAVRLIASCEEMWCVNVNNSLFLLNPSLRTRKKLPCPPSVDCPVGCSYYGMGYDPVGDDYKVLRVPCNHDDSKANIEGWHIKGSRSWAEMELFSLRIHAWRKIPSFPGKSKPCNNTSALLHGAVHWMVYPLKGPLDIRLRESPSGIISFDLSTDELREVQQPEYYPATRFGDEVFLMVLKGMLCVFLDYQDNGLVIWVMKEYGVQESWSKIYDIKYENIPFITPKYKKTYFTSMPLYLYEDGQILIMVCNTSGESEIMVYKDDQTMVRPVVGRDWAKIRRVIIYVESLISPHVKSAIPSQNDSPTFPVVSSSCSHVERLAESGAEI